MLPLNKRRFAEHIRFQLNPTLRNLILFTFIPSWPIISLLYLKSSWWLFLQIRQNCPLRNLSRRKPQQTVWTINVLKLRHLALNLKHLFDLMVIKKINTVYPKSIRLCPQCLRLVSWRLYPWFVMFRRNVYLLSGTIWLLYSPLDNFSQSFLRHTHILHIAPLKHLNFLHLLHKQPLTAEHPMRTTLLLHLHFKNYQNKYLTASVNLNSLKECSLLYATVPSLLLSISIV